MVVGIIDKNEQRYLILAIALQTNSYNIWYYEAFSYSFPNSWG